MTVPAERYRAILQTREFMLTVMYNYELPAELRECAYSLLRHYPTEYYLDKLAEVAPTILETPSENRNRI